MRSVENMDRDLVMPRRFSNIIKKLILLPFQLIGGLFAPARAVVATVAGRAGLTTFAENLYLWEIKLRPTRRASILSEMAAYYDSADAVARAIECYIEVLRLTPNDVASHVQLADLYQRASDVAAAKMHLTAALAMGGFNTQMEDLLKKQLNTLTQRTVDQ